MIGENFAALLRWSDFFLTDQLKGFSQKRNIKIYSRRKKDIGLSKVKRVLSFSSELVVGMQRNALAHINPENQST